MNPDHKETPVKCDHEMEEAELEVLGPPKLGPPDADGSRELLDTDAEGRDVRNKGTVPGHKCRKCGLEIPTNTCSLPPEPLNLKYVVVVTERDQHGNETEVTAGGHRFYLEDDGGLVVVGGDHDRLMAAWAKGRWVKVHMKLDEVDG